MQFKQLAIFAKYWEAGKVMTRLAADWNDHDASQLQFAFIRHLTERFRFKFDLRTLVVWPPSRCSDFSEIAGNLWHVQPQAPGDLGEKLKTFFAQQLDFGNNRSVSGTETTTKTVVLGSDSPTIPDSYIEDAFLNLESSNVVLGPSIDGGYYLIGMSLPSFDKGEAQPKKQCMLNILDDIDWGSGNVWSQTISKLEASGIEYSTLPKWRDVDLKEDLIYLINEIRMEENSGKLNQQLLREIETLMGPKHHEI